MGYELSIQREDNQTKLTKEEWIDYIKSDSEFKQIEEFSAELNDGKSLIVPTPNAGLWKTDNGEVPFTFDEDEGWISVKNPNKRIIKKMISIANILDSVVIGEEGEKYDENNLLGKLRKDDTQFNKKWWQFWKYNQPHKSETFSPKLLESDIENDLFIGDCFCSLNKGFDIGLVLIKIYQGQNGKYYSFAPVLLDTKSSSMDKFRNGQIKFQPNLGTKTYGIPAIGIMKENELKELKDSYPKEGKIELKKPFPNSTSTSYLMGLTEKHLTDFVDELEMYFTEKERKRVPVLKLIK